jgi:putative transposase
MKGEQSISTVCKLLRVSRSGYYRWVKRQPTQRDCEDVVLGEQIREQHRRGRGNYGAPRIVAALHADGIAISKRRCARLMKARGLRGRKKPRRWTHTTDSKHAHPPAQNLLAQQLPPSGPDQAWATDITYLRTAEGWLYVAAILDLWSRRIVGWSCSSTLHVALVQEALSRALRLRRPPRGLLHHSDRGVQYACEEYRSTLAGAGLVCSMSRKGNCYDNATIESFWSTLKTETGLDDVIPKNRSAAKLIVFDFIETFYNPSRRHSSLGYLSPVDFENRSTQHIA